MSSALQRLVKRSAVYPAIQEWRHKRELRRWAANDQVRLEFYRQLIRPDDLVFDIGANLGNRSKVFLRLDARVVAFEPQLSCARILQAVLGHHPGFRLVQKALGEKSCVAEMHISPDSMLSTLSGDWIESVCNTGRFSADEWTARERVQVSTFDEVIALYGAPNFAKIDVEGYEKQVLAGLSHPIGAGSVEFAAEALGNTIWCLERLQSICPYEFQFSEAESMVWSWEGWRSVEATKAALTGLVQADPQAWGDVYFRRTGSSVK